MSHSKRERLHARFPQHITLRLVGGAPSLAREWLMKVIRQAIRVSHKPDFRVIEFNILANHLHLITEASGNEALARGMQGLEVRLARRLNSALKRQGKLFAQRFHARYLTTPRQVRNTLRYVLLNRKHHAADQRFAKFWVDPCSSGPWFDGWAQPLRFSPSDIRDLAIEPRPTSRASTWLLSIGWRRHGPIAFHEQPS